MQDEKKIILSGIQPSGNITIGNYIGAIKNWLELQSQYNCYFMAVDMHAITVDQVPSTLRQNTLKLIALYLAFGFDPDKVTLFVQSHVHEHAELTWILNSITYFGEAGRMIQFKEKSAKHKENVNVALFDYPVLMAADILLYQSDLVPVGIDQKQHLELARVLSDRFNKKYSDTFKVPEGFIPKQGAKIMSLQSPESKMSKSDEDENAFISVLDTPDVIMRKFKRAVTDSETIVRAAATKPGITNLLTIYASFAGCTIKQAEAEFENLSYADFKVRVAEAVIAGLSPMQSEFNRIIADKAFLNEVMKKGAEKAQYTARKTLSKVYRKVGFVTL